MGSNGAVEIREVLEEELARSVEIVRSAFGTVARDLGITPENWPNYSGFLTLESLLQQRQPGERFFGLFAAGEQVGFVTIQGAPDSGVPFERKWTSEGQRPAERQCIFRKLAVLPTHRGRGYGRHLMAFVMETARTLRSDKVMLVLVAENTRLCQWYEGFGFHVTETKRFPGVDWTIGFMEKKLEQQP